MTKERIVSAAQALFVGKGFKGASVRAISLAAGANLASINYYFKSKKGLYRACLEELTQTEMRFLSDRADVQVANDVDPLKALNDFTNTVFETYLSKPNLLLLALQEIEQRIAPDFRLIEEIAIDLQSYFESLIEKRILKNNLDPVILTAMYFSLIAHAIKSDQIRSEKFGFSLLNDKNFKDNYVKHIAELLYSGIIKK